MEKINEKLLHIFKIIYLKIIDGKTLFICEVLYIILSIFIYFFIFKLNLIYHFFPINNNIFLFLVYYFFVFMVVSGAFIGLNHSLLKQGLNNKEESSRLEIMKSIYIVAPILLMIDLIFQ
jgi:hypothetical protein